MKKLTFVALFFLCSTVASAGIVSLNFSGLQTEEKVLNYYNGGTGGNGSGPGPNYGIYFGPDSIAGVSSAAGGADNNFNQPSGSSTCLYFLTGSGDLMDVPAGFTTGFSFYESGPIGGTVSVYSGLDGTGTLLSTLLLPATPFGSTDGGLVNGYYSVWDPVGVTFSGTAESVLFSGSANYIAFDDITLGSPNPGPGPGPVPEPATLLLLGSGLLGFAGFRKRMK
ncbi:MAG: PEP-CTERM sorting domain-containing protein [Desulfomonilia bacterium]|jgi:hypothetical protein